MEKSFQKMISQISHRGSGYRLRLTDSFGVGSVNLCESDVEISNHNKIIKAILAFDGELYNSREIESELRGSGVRLTNSGQGELVLYALMLWGVERAVKKFDGMFALVFYDFEKGRLWLVRDRMGTKPLYYWNDGRTILFSSEIKALLVHPIVRVTPNVMAILQYIREDFIDRTKTLFCGIEAIQPGSIVEYSEMGMHTTIYYDPIVELDCKRLAMEWSFVAERKIEDELNYLIQESVKKCASGSDKVGAFCSGGVDSALLCFYAKNLNMNFSMIVAEVEDAYPEYIKASFVAARLKNNIDVVRLSNDEFLSLWPLTVWYSDQPTFFQSDQAFYFLCCSCRRNNIEKILIGEGADELFGGYRWYSQNYKSEISVDNNPSIFFPRTHHHFFEYNCMLSTHYFSSEYMNMRELRDLYLFGSERYHRFSDLANYLSEYLPFYESLRIARQIVDLYERLSMLLQRADRMSMASAVKCVTPYLANSLVSYACSLPLWCRYKEEISKPILRQIASRFLPPIIAFGAKRAFAVNGSVYRAVVPFLQRGYLANLLCISKKTENIVLNEIYQGKMNQSLLYRLGSLELWGRIFFNNESPDYLGDMLRRNKKLFINVK